MKTSSTRWVLQGCGALVLMLMSWAVAAQSPPARQEGSWTVKDFRFNTGEVLPELRLHYTTLGQPSNEAVLVLHGTTGSGAGLLNPAFGEQLFGPGQTLDAGKYFIILPDAIGHGKSSKPSDGLLTAFPRYNYNDMVDAAYRLLTEHLNVKHVRLVIGNSMGGMETWIWGARYPGFMDALVPMASLPSEMSSRNWILRRLIIDSIRNNPNGTTAITAASPRARSLRR